MKKTAGRKERNEIQRAYKAAQFADKKYRKFSPILAQSSNYIWRKLLGF